MGDDIVRPALLYKILGVVCFIGSYSDPVITRELLDHLKSCFPLAGSRGLGHIGIDCQTISVFHEYMARVRELGFLAFSLLGQFGFPICCGSVRSIGAFLSMEIDFLIAASLCGRLFGRRAVFWTKTLKRCPGFQERTIYRKMRSRQQCFIIGFGKNFSKEFYNDICFNEPVAVF